MKRRIIAAVVAVVLAGAAAFGLYSYVRGADARALAGQETAEVLVITKAIPKGTPTEQMTKSVTAKLLPRVSVAEGVLTSLDEVSGLIAGTDLMPGEQVLGNRFIDPASLTTPLSAPVPKGLQELSLQLDTQRVIGGNLVPGDTVGVILTVGEKPHRQTHMVAGKVLVSRVQGGLAPVPADGDSADQTAPLPEATSVMATLAVTAAQAEKIVHAAEDGNVWLTHETADDNEDGTKIINDGNALK